MANVDSLIKDLKSRLESKFFKVKCEDNKNIVDIEVKSRFYKKYERIMMLLKLNSNFIIYYYDLSVEPILRNLSKPEEYNFEYHYVDVRIP